MQLARALTKRFGRSASSEKAHETNVKPARPTISMPMGLISTTNQTVYDQPSLSASQVKAVQQRQISSSSSSSSINDSETNTSATPGTPGMTDTSSVESYSPLEPNNLSQYFPSVIRPTAKPLVLSPLLEPDIRSTPPPETATWRDEAVFEQATTPALPKRAPSHSVREHERLARARSIRSSSPSPSKSTSVYEPAIARPIAKETYISTAPPIVPLRSRSRPASTVAKRTSTSIFEVQAEPNGPFSQELMQLQEVAKEFAAPDSPEYSTRRSSWGYEAPDTERDMEIMQEKGLGCHRASDYLRDISLLRQTLWYLAEDEEEEEVRVQEDDEDDDHEEFHDAVSALL